MKLVWKIALSIAVGVFAWAFKNEGISVGDQAPLQDVKMEDISGSYMSLNDLKKANGLVVIFSCNTCPFVLGTEETYPFLGTLSDRNEIGMVLVNSNEAKRPGDDEMSAMQAHAGEKNYNTPYVIDADHQLADAFGANTTPHVYLFDSEMTLVYTGAIDDRYEQKSKEPTVFWLKDAMMDLAAGRADEIKPRETKNIGCSIKRVKK